MRRVSYADRHEAAAAAHVLEEFGLTVTTSVELVTDEDEAFEMWEVCCHELPARRVAEVGVVPGGLGTTPPGATDPDEHDMGASTWWDREWERDWRGY